MSTIESIPVSLQFSASSMVAAILQEIDALLTKLLQDNQSTAIDLRSLPLFPGDEQALKDMLGVGEVTVKLNALGPSEIFETLIPGVWWCTHYNEAQEKIAEIIEITRVPAIVQTDEYEMRGAREKLKTLIERTE